MTKTILCLCRDVTVEDVRRAVAQGYSDIETLKRFTGALTGPCQGKTCLESIRRTLAECTGRDLDEIPAPPCRPPSSPVRLGILAAREQPPDPSSHAEASESGASVRSGRRRRAAADPRPVQVVPGATADEPAATADVVIIGAGLQGLALAYELAKRGGGRIAVVDAAYPGSGASGRNGEMIRSAFASREWIGLFDDSLRRWQRLSAELDFNVLFTKAGYLLLASTEEAHAAQQRSIELQRACGLHVELLDHDEVRRLCPAMAPQMIAGGLLQTDAGFAHHDATVWAYARAAARLGVRIHPHTTVTHIGVTDGGVTSVVTDRGMVSTRVVVDAAGGQAREVALLAGVDVPLEVFQLEAMVTEPLEPFLRPAVSSPAIMGYCHQTTRGEFVGGTEPEVPVPCQSIGSSFEGARDMAQKFVRLFPALAGVRMMRHWSGVVSQTADVAPILCEAPGCRGLYLDCGWVYGFVGAPAAAALMAELIATGRTSPTLEPFHADRFTTGRLIRETSLVVAALPERAR